MNKIINTGVLKKINTLADGGVDYVISTHIGEENPLPLVQKPIVFLIQEGEKLENPLAISEAIKESGIKVDYDKGKSPSQRLRAVLYVLWHQSTGDKTQQQHYDEWMEKIIGTIKDKLE